MEPILLITRPRGPAESFAASVQERLVEPVHAILSPIIRIAPVQSHFSVDKNVALILTSGNGVEAAKRIGFHPDTCAFCVGEETTRKAKNAGLASICAGKDAEALVAYLAQSRPDMELLHIHGTHTRGAIVERLREMGLSAQGIVGYEQIPETLSEEAIAVLAGTQPVVLPLFSPRSAGLLRDVSVHAALHVIAMSQAVAKESLGLAPKTMKIVAAPTAQLMIEETVQRVVDLRGSAT